MTAEIIAIDERLPPFDPLARAPREEPATVIILPVVRIEHAPDGIRQGRRRCVAERPNDCLPCDSEP